MGANARLSRRDSFHRRAESLECAVQNLGVSNSEITFYTSLLYLPWVIKPLWSPLVDIFKDQTLWVILTQMLIGASLFALSLSLRTSHFLYQSRGLVVNRFRFINP